MHHKNKIYLGIITTAMLAGYHLWESSNRTIIQPYFDYSGVATVCDGHTSDVDMQRIYTKQECQQFRTEDLTQHLNGMLNCVKVPLEQHQVDAFTLFASNVGVKAFCNSINTVIGPLNRGDIAAACNGLRRWVYVGNQRVQGLINRREYERKLCLGQFIEPKKSSQSGKKNQQSQQSKQAESQRR